MVHKQTCRIVVVVVVVVVVFGRAELQSLAPSGALGRSALALMKS